MLYLISSKNINFYLVQNICCQHNKIKLWNHLLGTKVIKMSSISNVLSHYGVVKYLSFFHKNVRSLKKKQALFFHTSSFLNIKGREIKMPSLSPTMSEGRIVKWLKKEGDPINPGDVLCDVETDKAIMSMETEEEGILAKIIISENSKNVSVGSLIALMVESGEDWQEIEVPKSSSAPVKNVTEAEPQPEKMSGSSAIQVKMPSLSPTMTAGTILKWYKKEGDTISAGDVLCDIQTDKAVISFETDEDGILAKILIPEDKENVEVGTLIALIVNESEDWTKVEIPQSEQCKTVSGQEHETIGASPSTASIDHSSDKSKALYGPAVRSLLSVYQLEASSIQATGRNNTLLKGDVLKFIEENNLKKKPPKPVSLPSILSHPSLPSDVSVSRKVEPIASAQSGGNNLFPDQLTYGRRSQERYTDIELTNVRRVIAKRLTESKQKIPHVYGTMTCQVDDLIQLRKDFTDRGMKSSLNDYIIKGTAFALEACPKVNVININDEYKHSATVDIAVAVATPNGLITPIIADVANKSVGEISETIRELASRARSGKLKPHEFQGGSFTISNLGMFGIKHFTAIINPPQSAILAVGSLIERYGLDRKMHYDISFTLSYDRRALEEDEAAEFLEKLKFFMENPKQLVVENVSAARAFGL